MVYNFVFGFSNIKRIIVFSIIALLFMYIYQKAESIKDAIRRRIFMVMCINKYFYMYNFGFLYMQKHSSGCIYQNTKIIAFVGYVKVNLFLKQCNALPLVDTIWGYIQLISAEVVFKIS